MDLRRSELHSRKKRFQMISFFIVDGRVRDMVERGDTHILWSLDEGPPAIFWVRS